MGLITVLVSTLMPSPMAGQTRPDPVLSVGGVRWHGEAELSTWSEGYGADFTGGPDLDEEQLVPGLQQLHDALVALNAVPASSRLNLGARGAFVERSVRRVPLGVEVGVFDWLTLGAEVDLIQTNVFGELDLIGDSEALGVNPVLEERFRVLTFLAVLADRSQQAAQLAASACAIDPASSVCADASAAAGLLEGAASSFQQAYAASPLFPSAAAPAGQALLAWQQNVDSALGASGIEALGVAVPLAAGPLTAEAMAELSGASSPFAGTPLDARASLWRPGDLRLSAAVRLVDFSSARDSLNAPGYRFQLAAIGGVRLPTAQLDSLDIYGERGMSQGQLDLEAGVWAALTASRLALRAEARLVRQQSAIHEVSPTAVETALGYATRTLDVDPGDLLDVVVEPAFRLAPALSIGGLWRYSRRGAGQVTEVASPAADDGAVPPSSSTLASGAGLPGFAPALGRLPHEEGSVQELGGTVTYRTAGLGSGDRGFEVWFALSRTIGEQPAGLPSRLRGSMGLRLVRRLWGGANGG